MSSFLDTFPKILYDQDRKIYRNYQVVTNLLFRVGILKEAINNISAYYTYHITDEDRPDILAERLYGDPEAYWVIMYANDIYDPQYDWPLNSRDFEAYITDKYGSVAYAQTTIHHYEKVVQREESLTGLVTEYRMEIDQTKLTDNDLSVPYDYYTDMPEEQSIETINMNGRTVIEKIFRNSVTIYDWEDALNEKKRSIKLIKPEYYGQIINELGELTGDNKAQYTRRLI